MKHLPKKILTSCSNFCERVERKRGSYDALTMVLYEVKIFFHMNLSYELKKKEIAVSSISTAEVFNDKIYVIFDYIVDYRVGICPFSVCNVISAMLLTLGLLQ